MVRPDNIVVFLKCVRDGRRPTLPPVLPFPWLPSATSVGLCGGDLTNFVSTRNLAEPFGLMKFSETSF